MANLHIAGTTEIDDSNYTLADLKNNMVYSTNEVNTGKKWIDGKTIYRKVVNFGSFPNNTNKTIELNVKISRLIDLDYTWYDSMDKVWINGLRRDSGDVKCCVWIVGGTKLYIEGIGANWSNRTSNGYAVIEYTKA